NRSCSASCASRPRIIPAIIAATPRTPKRGAKAAITAGTAIWKRASTRRRASMASAPTEGKGAGPAPPVVGSDIDAERSGGVARGVGEDWAPSSRPGAIPTGAATLGNGPVVPTGNEGDENGPLVIVTTALR